VVLYSLLLAAVVIGMITVLVRTAQGAGSPARSAGAGSAAPGRALSAAAVAASRTHEPVLMAAAPAALLLVTLALGFFIPGFLDTALRQAARLLGV
jgi:hypothetical protein